MPPTQDGIPSSLVHTQINALINNLVNIQDSTGEFLLRLDDGRVIDTKGWAGWEWTHGIGLYGLWHYHELTNDPAPLKIIEDWFRDRFAEGGTTKNINTMGPFLTLACVYERYGGDKGDRAHYKPWLEAWGEWAMWELERTEGGGMQHVTYLTPNTQQLWDDTLMMTALPLAKIGQVLNRPHYIHEAQKQFLLHIQYLQDPLSGLFFHGWEFTPDSPDTHGHHFACALWGRGNSWLTIAIPEILSLLNLPTDHFFHQHLLTSLRMQLRALARYQDQESGLWHTIINHSDKASYLESSCAAGFAFGMLKALRMRLIGVGPDGEKEKEQVEKMAIKAIKGVLAKIDKKGELTSVSFGTPVFDTLQGYKDIPVTSMPYGQAMGMMALVEWLRKYI